MFRNLDASTPRVGGPDGAAERPPQPDHRPHPLLHSADHRHGLPHRPRLELCQREQGKLLPFR